MFIREKIATVSGRQATEQLAENQEEKTKRVSLKTNTINLFSEPLEAHKLITR